EARLTLRTGAAPLAVGGEVSAGLAADGTAVRQPGGTLALVADDMAVAAPLRAPAGVVALTVHTAGTGIGLAGGAGGLALSAAELGFVDT
ncbi:hypothetical protein OFB80_30440, partial [Escherichia coli]|nr:hypothetical protein [Escherichia coli]